jgi:hypothetical protein
MDHVKETIKKYGVAIIPNVLTTSELNKMNSGMWDYLEHITHDFKHPIDRHDHMTWIEFLKLYPKHSMLLQNCQVGHSQFVWDVRQNPKVVDIFAKLWDCQPTDLLTSYDGVSFHMPPEITNRGWFRNLWYHTDQSYLRPTFECIQSWITGYHVNPGDATLSFLESSHIYHKEFQETFNIQDKSDWFKLSEDEHIDFYKQKGCVERKIQCPEGSMVLWDSRTIHCGTEPQKKRPSMNFRNVVYICMTPKKLASEKNILKKQKAFRELRMTSHWPHKPTLFSVNARTYGGPIYETLDIPKPILSELGRSLCGF